MKVKEMIAWLQKLDPEAVVVQAQELSDGRYGYQEVYDLWGTHQAWEGISQREMQKSGAYLLKEDRRKFVYGVGKLDYVMCVNPTKAKTYPFVLLVH